MDIRVAQGTCPANGRSCAHTRRSDRWSCAATFEQMNCSATPEVIAVGSRECVILRKTMVGRRGLFCLYVIPDVRALRNCGRCPCGRASSAGSARSGVRSGLLRPRHRGDDVCPNKGAISRVSRDHLVRSRSRSEATSVGLFAGRSFDEGCFRAHDAEFVSLRIGENGPGFVAGLPDVDPAGAEPPVAARSRRPDRRRRWSGRGAPGS
jgi:hypothetical protein